MADEKESEEKQDKLWLTPEGERRLAKATFKTKYYKDMVKANPGLFD